MTSPESAPIKSWILPGSELEIPVVPIYIQEKVHPQAIIDALPRVEQDRDDGPDLFGDFNGGPVDFAQKIDFYHHEQNWSNRLILGDSLLVMTSLAEKEGLKRSVQAIYFDPPYGIKFGSNWQVSTRKRDVKDGKAEDATRQPEQVRAFRDTWELGIHSYLAYLRDRLSAARDLLTETGSVFVQIGDENVHLVRCVLDEVFGSGNFVALINFRSMNPLEGGQIEAVYDYIVWYARTKEHLKYRNLWIQKPLSGAGSEFIFIDDGESYRQLTEAELADLVNHPEVDRVFKRSDLASSGYTASCTFPITFDNRVYLPVQGRSWRTTQNGIKKLVAARRLFALGQKLYFKMYHSDFGHRSLENSWTDTAAGFSDPKVYVVQTASRIIERCLLMTSDPGDLVLDPTCGSGTTAYVAEQWGRRWITCDTSRVAIALARTRLMTARFQYYLLADSNSGIAKEAEISGKISYVQNTDDDIRKGFVYKRVPHVTLKSIANNPDVKEGMTRQEVDAAIARHAESEMLFDQPYEDSKRVRVCGPFTVESLSPHRVLSTAHENQSDTLAEQKGHKLQDFATMILANLKKAGVQNTRKSEHLTFDRLDTYAGAWLHATGEYRDAQGTSHRVAVSIGPEHGTVGPQQVKEAAKEAVQGVGFDMLLICGFAFDPHVAEEVKRYGKLTVLATKMNPDLAMGEELLKKTGAGNLFMVFGEPDVEITKQKTGQLLAEIKGLDVYDPTTGQIRNASTDDIACWFIDTDYNGESFFVRHAYFTGAASNEDGGPYDKLKRALRAEINEAAWTSIYSTVSRPFDRPESGKIAVKVINHYGDEVLKVYEIDSKTEIRRKGRDR